MPGKVEREIARLCILGCGETVGQGKSVKAGWEVHAGIAGGQRRSGEETEFTKGARRVRLEHWVSTSPSDDSSPRHGVVRSR